MVADSLDSTIPHNHNIGRLPKNNEVIHLTLYARKRSFNKFQQYIEESKNSQIFHSNCRDTRIWYFSSEHFTQAARLSALCNLWWAVQYQFAQWAELDSSLRWSRAVCWRDSYHRNVNCEQDLKTKSVQQVMSHLFRMLNMSRLPARPGPRLWPLLSFRMDGKKKKWRKQQ